jgi:hypothetical protein
MVKVFLGIKLFDAIAQILPTNEKQLIFPLRKGFFFSKYENRGKINDIFLKLYEYY